jgi:hypothetical protein
MSRRSFSLQPFDPASSPPGCLITGGIARQADILTIRYLLKGSLEEVMIPAPAANPARRHRLWEATCFEFFLGVKQAPQYWEFNLSPAGHWNVYRFAGYRQGLEEEGAFTSLPVRVRLEPESLELALTLQLGSIVAAPQPLEVAVAAVVKRRNGRLTYWALTHGGPQPDFHRRAGFTITLEAGPGT